jgi:hypothetical protein
MPLSHTQLANVIVVVIIIHRSASLFPSHLVTLAVLECPPSSAAD